MANYPVVTQKKGEGRALKAGGMWIYDNEIASIDDNFENGGLVNIHDFDGYPLGVGYINTNSKITVRLFSRKDVEINDDYLRMRLQNAWDYRKHTVDTSSCRIVFGEVIIFQVL